MTTTAPTAAEISRLTYRLIQLDIGLARELHRILWLGCARRLENDLGTGIGNREKYERAMAEKRAALLDESARRETP
jgi:hypothetical protein